MNRFTVAQECTAIIATGRPPDLTIETRNAEVADKYLRFGSDQESPSALGWLALTPIELLAEQQP